MELVRYDSAAAYLDAVGEFLAAREAEHNLPLGILGTLRDRPEVYRETPYLAVVRDGAAIALAAIRTPPFPLVLSEAGVDADALPAALDALVADLAHRDRALPGAIGPRPIVGRFAAAWTSAIGRRSELEVAERIYRVARVRQPRAPGGRWRFATEDDRALLLEWVVAFHDEALPEGAPRYDLEAMVGRWIGDQGRTAYLWEVEGRVVSLVAAGSQTPNGSRIGPVYTPPGERGNGYASALTAAASQHQLDSGRRFCFLFTDLSNPTSNRIYRAIGYEPVTDVDQYRFID